MSTFNLTTNANGQRETYINGKKYSVQTDKYGDEFVVIDGKRVNLKTPLFENEYSEKIDKATQELNKAKKKAFMWGEIFDMNLEGVRKNREERIAFKREYGNDINSLNPEEQEQYKTLLAEGSEYSTNKNTALGRQLSYTNLVISLAGNKRQILNQASIFGV